MGHEGNVFVGCSCLLACYSTSSYSASVPSIDTPSTLACVSFLLLDIFHNQIRSTFFTPGRSSSPATNNLSSSFDRSDREYPRPATASPSLTLYSTSPIEDIPDGVLMQTARLTWRCINDQIIQFSPSHFRQKLPDHSILLGSSPDHTIPTIFEQESNTHYSQPSPLIHIYRDPTR